jgi:hypothetical protein
MRSERTSLDEAMEALVKKIKLGRTKGEMNYIITRLVLAWVRMRGVSYANLSDGAAVLNDAKVEFERTMIAPYEQRKREENGDVL